MFVDLDGTIAPIADAPQDVGPDDGRRAVLDRVLAATSGRLAVVSGRTIADVDRILDGRIQLVAGLHGLERRDWRGRISRGARPEVLDEAREEARAYCERDPRLLLEDKALSIAIHFRAAPERSDETKHFACELGKALSLVVQEGKMVVELRPPGPHKGDAVRAFMQEPPLIGATPVFAGDDLTDEDGFAAAASLGGAGVLVGPPRKTHASMRIEDPASLLAWFKLSIGEGAFVLEDG